MKLRQVVDIRLRVSASSVGALCRRYCTRCDRTQFSPHWFPCQATRIYKYLPGSSSDSAGFLVDPAILGESEPRIPTNMSYHHLSPSGSSAPQSVERITRIAQDYEYNPLIPLRYWLRSAATLMREVCQWSVTLGSES